MEKKGHFFFAISLPDEIKFALKEACMSIKEYFPFKRWVHHEDYHITLAFLGQGDERIFTAQRLVANAIKGQRSFPLKLNQLGIFGKGDAPRIFWADTEKEERLSAVRSLVYSACTEAGFQLETRPFTPHITIARKWSGAEPFQKRLLIEKNPLREKNFIFKANEIVLYQTNLDKTPKYERIAIFPLLDE